MKRLLFVLFALLPMCSFAQEVEVRRVEGSISLGVSFFEDSFYESTAGEIGLLSSVELRYNLRNVSMDVGIMSVVDIRGGDCELCNGSWEGDLSFLAVIFAKMSSKCRKNM